MNEFLTKVAATISEEPNMDAALVKVAAAATEAGLDNEQTAKLGEFVKYSFDTSKLDPEDLVKKALGKLERNPQLVDSFIEGVDAAVKQAGCAAEGVALVKRAVALHCLSQLDEMDAESAALWYNISTK